MSTLFFIIGLGVSVFAYENIALNKPAHEQFPYIHPKVDAGKAVDGLKSDLSGIGGQCSLSAVNQQTATWWVNLTNILSIHHITIYYRTDNVQWDANNGYTARFLGFSVYISNTTEKTDGYLCFKDDKHFTKTTIPAVFNITCTVHGQYVIYYNERLRNVNYPAYYSTNAYNELCEVEVYGCPIPGYYGSDCSIPCPGTHCRYCHTETGSCEGCKSGYQSHNCVMECNDGFYGEGCKHICGHCADLTQCHHVTGVCEGECEPGYRGDFCNQICEAGTYGTRCNKTCGYCQDGDKCFHTNGTCLTGCAAGYEGDLCNTTCPEGFFGENCIHRCNNTCIGCNSVNGLCETGCTPGWKGMYCHETCASGFYGKTCIYKCGKCSDGGPCHHVNGTCLQGCKAGYQSPLCYEECQVNKYGTNCNETCGKCWDSSQCHHVNGSCTDGCVPGFQGEKCITECDFGYYGFRCLQECSTFCKTTRDCHHVTGSCINGCKSGWQGNDCLEVLKAEDTNTDWKSSFYGMTGAFCITLAMNGLFIAYILIARRKKKRGANKYKQSEPTKHMENKHCETYENEVVDGGYQELGEFNKDSTSYSTLGAPL